MATWSGGAALCAAPISRGWLGQTVRQGLFSKQKCGLRAFVEKVHHPGWSRYGFWQAFVLLWL